MITMQLSEAARHTGGTLRGPDVRFSGCTTDSRDVTRGALFIALRGTRVDGHDYVEGAHRAGAAAAMVEQESTGCPSLLIVSDGRGAMGRLAQAWRARFDVPFVAVTGSNGKTTVKEMIAAILSRAAPVLATSGNQNNDIGVPLTLFRLGDEHRYGVVEMGANHAGEIGYLSRMTGPVVVAITQCAPAHLEGFGSVEGVANAKAEIIEGLMEGGTAVINADDRFAPLWLDKSRNHQRITFGLERPADVSADRIETAGGPGGTRFVLRLPGEETPVTLQLVGRHNVCNALAAAACCRALHVPPAQIREGLESVRAVKGRLEIKRGLNGSRIIDDTYNANPASLDAALSVLAGLPGRRWLVLGDMGELGPAAPALHREAGEKARSHGVDRLFATGELCRNAVDGFGAGARHFDEPADLIRSLGADLDSRTSVLIKGSRAMSMERIADALAESR